VVFLELWNLELAVLMCLLGIEVDIGERADTCFPLLFLWQIINATNSISFAFLEARMLAPTDVEIKDLFLSRFSFEYERINFLFFNHDIMQMMWKDANLFA